MFISARLEIEAKGTDPAAGSSLSASIDFKPQFDDLLVMGSDSRIWTAMGGEATEYDM